MPKEVADSQRVIVSTLDPTTGYYQPWPVDATGLPKMSGGGGSGVSFSEAQIATNVSVPASSWWNEPSKDNIQGYARVGYGWTWDASQTSSPAIAWYTSGGTQTGLTSPTSGNVANNSVVAATQGSQSQFQIKNGDSTAAHTLNAWCYKFPV